MNPVRHRCAFLMCRDLTDFVTDDVRAVAPLNARGWDVDLLPWDAGADWSQYDALVIRSTWDYQDRLGEFLQTLARMEALPKTLLANPRAVVAWNARKTYLRELAERGVPTVPTIWGDRMDSPDALDRVFDALSVRRIVVKPVVGANADHTYRLARPIPHQTLDAVLESFAARAYMAQPFVESIVREGEYSLIYTGGSLSHTILKTPKTGDFRVQEEHGGLIRAVSAEKALREAGERVLAEVARCTGVAAMSLVYARVDLARAERSAGNAVGGTTSNADPKPSETFLLMELELIEPALYFRMQDGSADRFAEAVDHWGRGRRRTS